MPPSGGVWADIGAGEGVFTRALAGRIGPKGLVYAVDRDAHALATLANQAEAEQPRVIVVPADFTATFELPGVGASGLDGLLFANSLHFASDAAEVLARLVVWLRPGGRAVVVEYDQRRASQWVPYPIRPARWNELAESAGLVKAMVTATRPSAFGGSLYAAVAEKTA